MASSDDEDDLLAQAVAEMEAKERGGRPAPLLPAQQRQQARPLTPPMQAAPIRAASVAPAPAQASPIPSRGPSPTPAPVKAAAPAPAQISRERQQVSSPVVKKIKSWGSSIVPGKAGSRALSRTAAPPAPPPGREEDEESEVEMLSISSEEGYEPVAPPGGAKLPGAAAGRQNEGARFDTQDLESELDDEDDATTWKQVDTEELADRALNVRSATRAGAVENLASRTLRRMSTIDTERLDSLQDPLGLGVINVKIMTLARAGASIGSSPSMSDSSKRRGAMNKFGSRRETSFGQDEISVPPSPVDPLDPADREKVLLYSENFDPQLYLSRFHRDTPAKDLELGERALKADLQNRKEQLKKLVKDNFDCFISCKNTIDDIHAKLQQIESDREGAGTQQLSRAIESVDEVAKRAFKPLLERQAQAERIRSVQGVLQRFRTLFNLPSAIRTHIKNKEYDLVVREYKKAKSLIVPTKAGILQNVLEEVDKVVAEFKSMLYKSLESPGAQPADVERTIKLLLELEPNSDPIWHYLETQEKRIRDELEKVAVDHDARMEAFVSRVREKVQAEVRWQQLQKDQTKGSQVDLTLLLGTENGQQEDLRVSEAAGEEADALLGRQIRRLTAVVVKHVPNFWRLWLAIYSGRFAKATELPTQLEEPSAGPTKAKAVAAKFPAYYKEDEKDSRYSKHPQEEVEQMVLGILGAYETKVQSTFLALAEATVLRPYMREAVLEVSNACNVLKEKDCAPHSAVQAMLVLRTEVTRVFVLRLCALMRGTTRELSYEEDWVPVPTAARNLTPYAVSAFPLRFGEMLTTALDHVTDALPQGQLADLGKDEALVSAVRSMQDSVRSTFFDCFQDYTECLTKMHADAVSTSGNPASSDGPEGAMPGAVTEGEYALPSVGRQANSPQQKIMLLLSNSAYVRTFLLRELVKQYQTLWTPSSLPPPNPNASPSRPHRGGPRPDYEKQLEEREAAAAAAAAVQQDLSGATGVAEVSETLSALEERLLEDYLEQRAASLGPAVTDYLLEDNTPWGQAPPVKGLRDAVLELLYPLVAVHAEVHAGARPFVGKAISILVENLVATLRSLCQERIRTLDANGYAQLMLEVDYLDIVLAPFATQTFDEAVLGLRGVLHDKVLATLNETTPGHSRRSSRADSQDDVDIGDAVSASPAGVVEEAQAAAKAASARFLEPELKRTRINVICFKEGGILEASGGGLTPPPHARPAPASSQSQARMSSQSPNGWQPPLPPASPVATPYIPSQSLTTPSPGGGPYRAERQHRRTSSLSSQDSDVSDVYRPASRLPPRSPVHQASSQGFGHEADGFDMYSRGAPNNHTVASSNRQAASSRTGWSSRRATDAEDLT